MSTNTLYPPPGSRIDGKYYFDVDHRCIRNSSTGEPIPRHEPVFLLRARDVAALPTLHAYYCACVVANSPDQHIAAVSDIIRLFEQFAESYKAAMHTPD